MKRQIIIVLSVILVVFGIVFITTKATNTNTEYAENNELTAETDTVYTENTVDLVKINTFIKAPTLANYRKLNSTERKDSSIIFTVKNLSKPILINAFDYTQRMDFEPASRFRIKNARLSAYIDSVKQLYCLNSEIAVNIKVIKAKRFPNRKPGVQDTKFIETLTIHDIYRKLLIFKEILSKYNEIANFKESKRPTNLTPNALDIIKGYRILLLNYRGVYSYHNRDFKNPYGLVLKQYKRLFNLGKILFMLKSSPIVPTFYNKNGKETKKGAVWGRIDSIIDKSCKN